MCDKMRIVIMWVIMIGSWLISTYCCLELFFMLCERLLIDCSLTYKSNKHHHQNPQQYIGVGTASSGNHARITPKTPADCCISLWIWATNPPLRVKPPPDAQHTLRGRPEPIQSHLVVSRFRLVLLWFYMVWESRMFEMGFDCITNHINHDNKERKLNTQKDSTTGRSSGQFSSCARVV